MTELSVICTDRGQHAPAELGVIRWQPGKLATGELLSAVWSTDEPLRDLAARPLGDSARATKSAHPNKQTHRAPVETIIRADGGATFVFPRCPRCSGTRTPAPKLRDDTLRKHIEKTRGTAGERYFDVSGGPVAMLRPAEQ